MKLLEKIELYHLELYLMDSMKLYIKKIHFTFNRRTMYIVHRDDSETITLAVRSQYSFQR